MGYTTVFTGEFELDKPLDQKTYDLLRGLAETRRMKRCTNSLEHLGLGKAEDFGVEGEFYIGEGDSFDYDSIVNANLPPRTQPGLYLQWVPTEDRKHILWDGGEKFYHAGEWIYYLIEKVLRPRGYLLSGIVNAQGESEEDQWHIAIFDNNLIIREGFHASVPIPDYGLWHKEYYCYS